MTGELQLTFDGREVPVTAVGRWRPLSTAQRDVMRVIGFQGTIRSAEAGRIVHAHRNPPVERPRFAGADGWAILRRLEQRGLVVKIQRGVWKRAA